MTLNRELNFFQSILQWYWMVHPPLWIILLTCWNVTHLGGVWALTYVLTASAAKGLPRATYNCLFWCKLPCCGFFSLNLPSAHGQYGWALCDSVTSPILVPTLICPVHIYEITSFWTEAITRETLRFFILRWPDFLLLTHQVYHARPFGPWLCFVKVTRKPGTLLNVAFWIIPYWFKVLYQHSPQNRK